MAQDDDAALALGQLPQRSQQLVAVREVGLRPARSEGRLRYRPLTPPRPPRLVQMAVDQDPTGVGVDVVGPRDPRPRDVQLDQRVLDEVLGLGLIAAQEVGCLLYTSDAADE